MTDINDDQNIPENDVLSDDQNNSDDAPVENSEPKAFFTKDYSGKVTVAESVFKVEDGHVTVGPKLSLLYSNLNGFNEFVNSMGEFSDYSKEWGESIQYAVSAHPLSDALEGLMERDSDWHQYVEVEGTKLRAVKPTIAKSSSGNLLVGQQAVARISALTQTGTIIKVPLWHSGLWVSIKAPQLSAWLELERRIALEKVIVGRSTRGLAFSNDSVFMVSHIVDFILNHVFDSTLQGWTTDLLRRYIKTPDLSFLATAMALTVFPEGHPHTQACMADATKCQHVVRGLLNLSKIMWVDRAALTEAQRKHMHKRDKVHTPSEIDLYQEQWRELPQQSIAINDELKVVYGMPSLEEYIEMGTSWINRIEEATESAFGANLRGQQREEYLYAQTQSTRIGLYAHWIKRFVLSEDDQVVEDKETIESIVTSLSSNVEVADKIINGAKAYIGAVTMSCVGIPNYKCPACGNWHLTEEGPMKAIIPIDAVATFFILLQSLLTSKLLR